MLEQAPKNKMQTKDTAKVVTLMRDFHFPDYQLTINASSIEEATEKLAEILKTQNK